MAEDVTTFVTSPLPSLQQEVDELATPESAVVDEPRRYFNFKQVVELQVLKHLAVLGTHNDIHHVLQISFDRKDA